LYNRRDCFLLTADEAVLVVVVVVVVVVVAVGGWLVVQHHQRWRRGVRAGLFSVLLLAH